MQSFLSLFLCVFFPLVDFKMFSLSLLLEYNVYSYSFLYVSYAWSLLSFFLKIYIFRIPIKFVNYSVIISSNMGVPPFNSEFLLHIYCFLKLSHSSQTLHSFFIPLCLNFGSFLLLLRLQIHYSIHLQCLI